MERTLWVDRKFTFDYPEGWIFDILERLRGTTVRIESMVNGLAEDQLTRKPNGKWSIKEQIGHLYDLEALHIGRLDDFMAGKDKLRAADMTNATTHEAHHNDRPVEMLISIFAARRKELLDKFDHLDDATQMRKALHPRLQVMMRPIDVAYFTAEHDDHHLCWIRILRGF